MLRHQHHPESLFQKRPELVIGYSPYSDTDGITATSLLSWVLEKNGAVVSSFLPHRFDDGYGFTGKIQERQQAMSEKDGMRIGKITQTAWQRTVRKQLHTEDKRTLFGASPWETCSGFETEGGGGYVWADACASGDDGRTG